MYITTRRARLEAREAGFLVSNNISHWKKPIKTYLCAHCHCSIAAGYVQSLALGMSSEIVATVPYSERNALPLLLIPFGGIYLKSGYKVALLH